MLKSDFSNYTGLNGRGTYLVRELLYLVEQAEQHPQTAAQLETLFNADVARVQAAITAAKARTIMSGPGGGPRTIHTTALLVSPSTSSGAVASTVQLTATKTPANATDPVVWTTSDATKATVSATGLVTRVATGSATITATSNGVTSTSTITVT